MEETVHIFEWFITPQISDSHLSKCLCLGAILFLNANQSAETNNFWLNNQPCEICVKPHYRKTKLWTRVPVLYLYSCSLVRAALSTSSSNTTIWSIFSGSHHPLSIYAVICFSHATLKSFMLSRFSSRPPKTSCPSFPQVLDDLHATWAHFDATLMTQTIIRC